MTRTGFASLFPPNLTVRWLVTHECNFRCRHCSYFGSGDERAESLDIDAALDVLSRLLRAKTARVTALQIVGGEPLSWPPLDRFLRVARAEGLEIEVVTNGTLVDEGFLDLVREHVLDGVCFSMDGVDARTYGILRDERRFSEVVENLGVLAAVAPSGVKVRVNYVVARGTDGDPLRIVRSLARWGADLVTFVPMNIAGLAERNQKSLELPPGRMLDFIDRFHQSLDAFPIPAHITIPPLVRHYVNRMLGLDLPQKMNGCPAITGEWTLTSDGWLDPCPVLLGTPDVANGLGARLYSVREESLDTILEDSGAQATRAAKGRGSRDAYEPCHRCPFLGNWCDPCFIQGLAGRGARFDLCLEAELRLVGQGMGKNN